MLQKFGLALPSPRTLRDYTHHFDNMPGFNVEVEKQLLEEVKMHELKEHEKHVCITADEMKIKGGSCVQQIK